MRRSHHRQLVKVPSTATRKGDIQDFLREQGVTVDPKATKATLLALVKAGGYKPSYAVEDIGVREGVSVLRLPPYHCHFNPIELAWSDLKKYVRQNNSQPDKPDTVSHLIQDAIRFVDGELPLRPIETYGLKAKWPAYCRHVRQEEQQAKLKEALILSDGDQTIVINPGDVSEEDSDSAMEVDDVEGTDIS